MIRDGGGREEKGLCVFGWEWIVNQGGDEWHDGGDVDYGSLVYI